jgi:hypothetical protein
MVGTATPSTGAALTVNGAIKGTIASGTSVASTSGTSIDFTGIPSWAKRVTVIFNGVSTNGTSRKQIQLGSGSVTTSGYLSMAAAIGINPNATNASGAVTTGFVLDGYAPTAATTSSGHAVFTLITGNTWICSGVLVDTAAVIASVTFGGNIALGGALDRVRITTVGGTDTFDAGSINILYEG